MFNIFNKLISYIIPALPKKVIWLIAKRYVAGVNIDSAINIVSKLNRDGYSVTLDILGEHTKTVDNARHITMEYCDIYEKIKIKNLDCNISVKPTHIGLDLNGNTYINNLQTLINKAKETNSYLRLDMENSSTTTKTLDSIINQHSQYLNIGTVVQAYLHRSLTDIKNFPIKNMNFRVCKGIYKENADVAIQDEILINNNFIDILKQIFLQKGFAAIATHDTTLIEKCYNLIDELDVNNDQFEFQALYGVPMGGYLEKHLKRGYNVRIYVPFGSDWYKYSIRRLKENPNIIGYIIKNLLISN